MVFSSPCINYGADYGECYRVTYCSTLYSEKYTFWQKFIGVQIELETKIVNGQLYHVDLFLVTYFNVYFVHIVHILCCIRIISVQHKLEKIGNNRIYVKNGHQSALSFLAFLHRAIEDFCVRKCSELRILQLIFIYLTVLTICTG